MVTHREWKLLDAVYTPNLESIARCFTKWRLYAENEMAPICRNFTETAHD